MKFYSITWCDYEGINRYALFSNAVRAYAQNWKP